MDSAVCLVSMGPEVLKLLRSLEDALPQFAGITAALLSLAATGSSANKVAESAPVLDSPASPDAQVSSLDEEDMLAARAVAEADLRAARRNTTTDKKVRARSRTPFVAPLGSNHDDIAAASGSRYLNPDANFNRSRARSRSPAAPRKSRLSPSQDRSMLLHPQSANMEYMDSNQDDWQLVTSRKANKSKASRSPPSSQPPVKTLRGQFDNSVPTCTPTNGECPINIESPPNPRSPPPIVVHDKGKWDEISKVTSTHDIQFTRARNTLLGISVQVSNISHYRNLTRLLNIRKIAYHTYTPAEDRVLRAVIRGVPKELDTSLIKEDLISQGLPVQEVHRLKNRHMGALDLVLVISDNTYEGKQIFKITQVCRLTGINVEPPRRNSVVAQCHRCQNYGHSQRNCHGTPRCVKCLGDHGTSDCGRNRDDPDPPGCVLCGQLGHTANYRGCPKAPRVHGRMGQKSSHPLSRSNGPRPFIMNHQDFPKINQAQCHPPPTAPSKAYNSWASGPPKITLSPSSRAPPMMPAMTSGSNFNSPLDLTPYPLVRRAIALSESLAALEERLRGASGTQMLEIMAQHQHVIAGIRGGAFP